MSKSNEQAAGIAAAVILAFLLILVLSPFVGLVFWAGWNLGISNIIEAIWGTDPNIGFFTAWFSTIALGVLRPARTTTTTSAD